jgi:hypothetical protein
MRNKTNKKTNKKHLSRNKKYKSKKYKKSIKVKKYKKSIKGGYEGASMTPKYIEIQMKGVPRGISNLSNVLLDDIIKALKKDLKEIFIRNALQNCLDELGNNGTPSENNIKVDKIVYDKAQYIYTIRFKVLCENCIPSDYEFLKEELEKATKSFEYTNTVYGFTVYF